MTGKKTPDNLNRLRLYLTANWPAQQTSCDWELLNASGVRLQMGNSEPRHWPPATRCEVILSAEQCLPLSASLPKGARTRMTEVIGYALEDRLLGDIDAEHFVAGDETHDGQTAVWVISRTRLQALLAVLRPLGHTPQRLISELQLLPCPSQTVWNVCLKSRNGFVRTASESGFSFDLPESNTFQPPLELQLALQTAHAAQAAPSRIDIHTEPGVTFDHAHISAWQTRLGVSVQHTGDYLWRDALDHTARNLLTGEFAPPRARGEGWSSLRPAALIAAFGLAIYSVFSFAEWAHLEHQKNTLRQQMTDRFRATFPQAQTIVDPVLQMQRLHDQLRRERGQLGTGDFLPLLTASTEAAITPNAPITPNAIHRIDFTEGRIELTLNLPDATAVEHLRNTLTQRGLGVVVRDTHPANGKPGVETILAIRGTP